jgi:hypothetical protein
VAEESEALRWDGLDGQIQRKVTMVPGG